MRILQLDTNTFFDLDHLPEEVVLEIIAS
jgi:hypothetical protein